MERDAARLQIAVQTAVNDLQTAVLLTGSLRTTLLSDLDNLATLKAALERAVRALRSTKGGA